MLSSFLATGSRLFSSSAMAASSSCSGHSLRIGGVAPTFSADALLGSSFTKVGTDTASGKYLCLFFYPLDWTFVCPTEILAFEEAYSQFQATGCEVYGASVDSVYSHLAWTQAGKKAGGLGGPLSFPLIADVNKDVSTKFNALLGETGHTCRALFIIDGKGNLRHAQYNDAPVGRNVEEALRLVQAFQFHDENGQVCPVNWKPGSRTMTPDPKASLEYFEAVNN